MKIDKRLKLFSAISAGCLAIAFSALFIFGNPSTTQAEEPPAGWDCEDNKSYRFSPGQITAVDLTTGLKTQVGQTDSSHKLNGADGHPSDGRIYAWDSDARDLVVLGDLQPVGTDTPIYPITMHLPDQTIWNYPITSLGSGFNGGSFDDEGYLWLIDGGTTLTAGQVTDFGGGAVGQSPYIVVDLRDPASSTFGEVVTRGGVDPIPMVETNCPGRTCLYTVYKLPGDFARIGNAFYGVGAVRGPATTTTATIPGRAPALIKFEIDSSTHTLSNPTFVKETLTSADSLPYGSLTDNSYTSAWSDGENLYVTQTAGNTYRIDPTGDTVYLIGTGGGATGVIDGATCHLKYTLTFDSQGGTPVDSVTVPAWQSVSRPANPTRAGFKFIDWFVDDEYTTAYDFDAVLAGNITLYAQWEEIPNKPLPPDVTPPIVPGVPNTGVNGDTIIRQYFVLQYFRP